MRFKLLLLSITLFLGFGLAACQDEDIILDVNQDPITLTEGDTFQFDVDTNDSEGVLFEVLDPTLLSINANGLITALKDGVTQVTISSVKNPSLTITIQVTIRKLISLTTSEDDITLKAGESIEVSYQSNDAVVFESSNAEIFTVSTLGIITGVGEGVAKLTIKSSYDESVFIEVDVEVRRNITLTIDETPDVIWVGESFLIDYESNGDVTFSVTPNHRASINTLGQLEALQPGQISVTITSTYDPSVSATFELLIYSEAQSIAIDGESKVNVNTSIDLQSTVFPTTSIQTVLWSSSNEDIATIDSEGQVTFHQVGVVEITATAKRDAAITQTFEITIIDTLVLNQSTTSAIFTYEGVRYQRDITMFNQFDLLSDRINEGTIIYVFEGNYNGEVILDKHNVSIIGIETHDIQTSFDVRANNITFENLKFTGTAQIFGDSFHSLTLSNSIMHLITHDDHAFLSLENVENTTIIKNHFSQITNDALHINGIKGYLNIHENIFISMKKAIDILVDPTEQSTPEIIILRNTIEQVELAIGITSLTPTDEKLNGFARFNKVSHYQQAVFTTEALGFDFTLNYWGASTLDFDLFRGTTEHLLRGYYQTAESIPLEGSMHPDVPLFIEFTNPISEIVMGETYQLEYGFLPMDFQTTRIRFLTSNPDVLGVTQSGLITPIRSGTATITVRSTVNSSMATTVTIVVTTTPGIDFAPTQTRSSILVGDQFLLNAETFPISYQNEVVSYQSSDPLIATVDIDGQVITHGAGTVTITATMINHPDVSNNFTFNVFQSLDENNLMDLLTQQQVVFATPREWRVYGVTFDFIENRYDSVSRYHFGEIPVNTSKIVPVSTGIRPGEGFAPHPAGITQYNPYNVYWVVVHETANTSPGAGALSHANYLWNLAAAGSQPFVSWHFTVDDKLIYQHLPEIERGFHAGDGSVLPGQSSTYLGGGNRNGIGIEMSVNQDGDMYRTWQRTAKLATHLLVKYNLPLSHMRYHIDFSGKMCPQSTIRGGMIPLFEEFAAIEYLMHSMYPDATLTLESHNPDLLDNTGRVIQRPDRGQTVSYTITINHEGQMEQRTFYTYLPGTMK